MGKIFVFGELVLGKPNKPARAGMECPWEEGVRVGRRTDDNCHIVVTDHGLMFSRSCRNPETLGKEIYQRVKFTSTDRDAPTPGQSGITRTCAERTGESGPHEIV